MTGSEATYSIQRFPSRIPHAVIFAVLASLFLSITLTRGWIPHDDGTLAHAAERVSAGELPHVDFVDPYTGGLSFLNAAVFRLHEASLSALRLPLLGAFALFSFALFRILARPLPTAAAYLVSAVAVVWSVPNYSAALPSWYNLFFSVWGLLSLFRFLETGRRGWILLAGILGGLSVTIKITGVYFLIPAGLTLLFYEQSRWRREGASRTEAGRLPGLSSAPALLIGLAVLYFLLIVLGMQPEARNLIHFLLPGTAIVFLLFRSELRTPATAALDRMRGLATLFLPLLVGSAIPLVIFTAPWLARGEMASLLHGVFILPRIRLDEVVFPPPPALTIVVAAIPLLALVLLGRSRLGNHPRALATVGIGLLALLLFGYSTHVYQSVWYAARAIIPLAVVGSVVLLWRVRKDPSVEEQRMFALTATLAFGSLIQYPHAVGIYYCYVAPLVVSSVVYLLRSLPGQARRVETAVAVFFLLFGLLWLNTSTVRSIGFRYVPDVSDTRLDASRGDIRVPEHQAKVYQRAVSLVQTHSRPGEPIYAGPDAPEIYFLAERSNPTRSIYEVFNPYADDHATILQRVEQGEIDVVVLHQRPEFSAPWSSSDLAELRRNLPFHEETGPFLVMWRGRGNF